MPSDLPIEPRALSALGDHLDGLVVRAGEIVPSYDLDAIKAETTVRGQFARDALLIADEDRQRKVLITGLRALEGRRDLEVA